MGLRWIGPPPTKAELRVLQNAARKGQLPKNGTIRRATRSQADAAMKSYTRFHWGDEPKRVKKVTLPSYAKGVYELGRLRAVEYETHKGGERAVWVHKFSKPYPSLTGTPGGKLGPIVGGRAFITERGIEK
ncbi:MAG: hypothetical protein ACRENK_16475 [Gemmatimonadaceae bacterium]